MTSGNPHFEFSAPPPRDFLRFLVSPGAKLTPPKHATGARTAEKRRALMAGDVDTLQEALRCIDDPWMSHDRKWWCFEGTSKVDCALMTDRLVLFIEGKRTERGPSAGVSWYQARNQVARNLDCARWFAQQHGLDYYALLIVEACELGDDRHVQADEAGSPETLKTSLPHLSKEQLAVVERHYLGWTTWQDIVSELAPGLILPA